MNEEIIKEARIRFGLLFKELRKEKKLNQQDVADFCGVTIQTINKVEQGKFAYSFDLVMKLSVLLDFNIVLEEKEHWNPDRFLLQESITPGYFVLTDTENGVVCTFKKGEYNESQRISFLEDIQISPSKIATIMREFGEWLSKNRPDLI